MLIANFKENDIWSPLGDQEESRGSHFWIEP